MPPAAPRAVRLLLTALALLPASAPLAAAQDDDRIGWLVADLRGSIVPFGQDAALAASRGVDPLVTPSLGFGGEAGAHLHFLRMGFVTLGVGGSYHTSLGDRRPREDDRNPDGPTFRKTFSAVSSQLSFNFGGRDGWSYLSGGIGRARLGLHPRDADAPRPRAADTLNYGGGARWFVNRRVAFSLDLRFYALSPLPATATEPAMARTTIMVLSAGASFK